MRRKIILFIVFIIALVLLVLITLKLRNNNVTEVQKVFGNPETIIYAINGKEKFKLFEDDEKYIEIIDKLNSSLDEGYTSKEVAKDKGYSVPLLIKNIDEEIYLSNSVLRLIYSDTYEIDIVFEENSVLDIIYIENGKYDCFYGFTNSVQDEIKKFVDNV